MELACQVLENLIYVYTISTNIGDILKELSGGNMAPPMLRADHFHALINKPLCASNKHFAVLEIFERMSSLCQ